MSDLNMTKISIYIYIYAKYIFLLRDDIVVIGAVCSFSSWSSKRFKSNTRPDSSAKPQ